MKNNLPALSELNEKRFILLTKPEETRILENNPENGVFIIRGNPRINGKFSAAGFSGKRAKPDWHYLFNSETEIENIIERWKTRLEMRAAAKEKRKEERRAKIAEGHQLKTGDVLCASWGWEQTNIDYYQVIRLIASRFVEIREIGKHYKEGGDVRGSCTPRLNHFVGEPMRKKVCEDGKSVYINGFVWALLKKPDENGCYASDHWTAYT